MKGISMHQLAVQEPYAPTGTCSDARNIWIAFIGAALFSVLAVASILISRFDGLIASIWLPNALAVAVLLRARLTNEIPFYAGIFLSSAAVNLLMGFDTLQAVIFAIANLVEIAIASILTRKLCGNDIDMESMLDLAKLILAAGIIAPVVSATIALYGLLEGGALPAAGWLSWFITDGLGMIVFVPLALLFAGPIAMRDKYNGPELGKNVAIIIAGAGVTILVFYQSDFPLLFIVPPIVLLCAFRLGSLGTAVFVLLVALIASIMTWSGTGPINLMSGPMQTKLLVMQTFVAASFFPACP
jgi:integral membrane sensor domain MASE1